ncbi:triose-phosphate isomerase [Betaproteobacteria bacterium]|nr:triose-phosphate isomerase [Betaproteobacteria bacterium]
MFPEKKTIVIGNWKMHGSLQSNEIFLEKLLSTLEDLNSADFFCGIALPAIYLFQFSSRLDNAPFFIGAQNVAQWEEPGAFTGEINAMMLAEFDCKFSIVGHSERRKYFGETDKLVAKKASNLLKSGIIPLVCVGEGQQEREKGSAIHFVKNQIDEIASCLGSDLLKKCNFAYEPIWAIGTGNVAKESDIVEMHGAVKELLVQIMGEVPAQNISLLYGGSVNAENVLSIVDQENVDGILVGGASVSMETFGKLLEKLAGRRQ